MQSRARRTLAFLLIAMATGAAGRGAAQSRADDDAWKTRLPAQLHIGTQASVAAQFEIACRDGKGGALGWSLIIAQPDAMNAFPLDDFEGPGGIGEKRVLAQWSVGDGSSDGVARTSISGWYGVDGDGFVLATSQLTAKPADLARLSRALIASAGGMMHLVVQPPEGKGDALNADAQIGDHREAIARILEPCLPPAKRPAAASVQIRSKQDDQAGRE
ncbi:MAG TPA: hypothetical protein VGC55_16895 [Dokdonella sp.]